MTKYIVQTIPSGTMVNNFTVASYNEPHWNYCFGVSTMDNYFPSGTDCSTVLPQIQAALDKCLANEATVRSFGTASVYFSFKNGLYMMRDTARDYGGTIEGAA